MKHLWCVDLRGRSRGRWLFLLICLALIVGFGSPAALAQAATVPWNEVSEGSIQRSQQARTIVPDRYRTLQLDRSSLHALLAVTPLEANVPPERSTAILSLPLPDVGYAQFRIAESPIMEPALAARFPEIRTWIGQGITDRTATLRFDLTPTGFHAQIISWQGTIYIDPFQPDDIDNYIVYHKRDYNPNKERMQCAVTGDVIPKDAPNFQKRGVVPKISSGTIRRTYRLAMAATGEYTTFHGGTVALAQAAIVTTMNRVNGIYERDLAVRMNLVANNTSVIYTNGATDPFTNNNGSTMLTQNQTNMTSVIGAANYDIGHVVSTGGGGIAALGSVCVAGSKAQGVTGSPAPIGDAFDVDYVAHEIGHQFGGNHTFNSSESSCGGGNRNTNTAFEPGSGSTIQAYAGICGTSDVQPNSDALFHRISLTEALTFVSGAGHTCPVQTATGNTPPAVSTPAAFNIPISTPFTLTATASDADGDTLTYAWEQMNLGTAANGALVSTYVGPIFRSFLPSTSPSRTFPRLTYILNNANVPPSTAFEVLPSTARTMNFTVTARDNRAANGGTNEASTAITVIGTAGPFVVTAPNTAITWDATVPQTVTWNVASTSAAPLNTATVRIDLSLDGGTTWITQVTGEANDGSATFPLNNATPSTQARIRVSAENSVYFDISNTNFTVTGTSTPTAILASPVLSVLTSNGVLDPNECNQVNLTLSNSGSATATGISATLATSTPNVTITQPTVAFANLPAGQSASGLTTFQISTNNALTCPSNVALTLTVTYGGGSSPLVASPSLPVGTGGGVQYQTQSAAAAALAGVTGPVTGSLDDDALVDITVPFSTQIYGTAVSGGSTLRASTNGNLQIVNTGGSSRIPVGTSLPNTGASGAGAGAFPTSLPVLMPFWADIDMRASAMTGGGIYTQTLGVAPNRQFVIEWRGELFNAATTTITHRFSIVLREGSNTFSYYYSTVTGGTPLVGVQAATTGTLFTQVAGLPVAGQEVVYSIPPAQCSAGPAACEVVPPQRGLSIGSITLPATIAGLNSATRVRFPQVFASTPVVIVQGDNSNADPQAIRIANVSTTGFDALAVEAPGCVGCTGAGGATTVHWLAAMPGSYRLPNENNRAPGSGVLVKVGTLSTSASQRATGLGGFSGWAAPAWTTHSFPNVSGANFTSTPVLLTTLQSWSAANEGSNLTLSPLAALNGASQVWMTTAVNNLTATGFDVALESSSVDDNGSGTPGIVAPETVGYVAIEGAQSTQLPPLGGGNLVGLLTQQTTVTDTCSGAAGTFPTGTSASDGTVRGFVGLVSRNENDGGWLRRCTVTGNGTAVQVQARIDEDADLSTDRSHPTSETLSKATFSGDFTTTPISLALLQSQRVGADLDVRFSSASEAGHLGYRIWGRGTGIAAIWQPLHTDLIVSPAGDGFSGKSYQRRVPGTGVAEIRIEDVDVLGRSRFHAELAVGARSGDAVIEQPLDWAAIRASNVASPARVLASGPAQVVAQVSRSGVQRADYEALRAAGFAEGVAVNALAVLVDGQPVPRFVQCSTPSFGPGCSVEWLGQVRESVHGSARQYLLLADVRQALRVAPGALAVQATGTRVVAGELQVMPDRAYSFSAPGSDPWYDERLLATTAPVSVTRTFSLPGRVAGTVNLEVLLWGGLDFPTGGPDHHVEILLNGQLLADRRFDGLVEQTVNLTVPESLLQPVNQLSIRLPADTGQSADVVLLDGFRVRYARTSTLHEGTLSFGDFVSGTVLPTADLLADGFETLGTTVPANGFALTGIQAPTVVWTRAGQRVSRDLLSQNAAIDPGVSALLAVASQQVERPQLSSAAPALPSSVVGRVDYLVITHPLFEAELEPLLALQRSRGLSVRVLRSDSIYATYSHHQRDPEALRAAIAAHNPRFVLLVGGDSYDYDNHLGLGSQSYLPTFYHVADPIVRFAASDLPFADRDGDGAPEYALGRLPVRTVEELRRAISGIVARGNTPALKYFASAGGSAANETFDLHSRTLLSFLRQGQPVAHGAVDELGLAVARQRVTEALAGNADWINYLGHSSPNRWAAQNLLDTSQLAGITRSGLPAIVSQWGCWNNYFVLPSQDTMSHALMLRSNQLAAAVIGSTSLAEDASHLALGIRLFDLVEDGRFDDEATQPIQTLGEALQTAKRRLASTAPEHLESNWSISLFGDPAMPLR